MIICVPVSLLAARRSKLDEINAHDEKKKEQMAFLQDAAIQSSKLADADAAMQRCHFDRAEMMQQIRALRETALENKSMKETAEPLETPFKNRHYREPLKNH